jgi:hypothetical protein
MPAVIRITPLGNLGNQMLQLMLALSLASRAPGSEIVGYDLPPWNLRKPAAGAPRPRRSVSLEGHLIDLDLIGTLMRVGLLRHVELRGYGFRMENYLPRAAYRETFSSSAAPPDRAEDDMLVISVRGAETLAGGHPDYGPVPMIFYKRLAERTGLRPLFIGQLGDDYYSRMLRRWFPGARFVPSMGPLLDFEFIRRSRNIVPSVSTFSWLAAWLSEAGTIHLPVLGLLNPRQRPDVDLLPWSDERYAFYEFPVRAWTASSRQIADLGAECAFRRMERSDVRSSLAEAASLVRSERRRSKRRVLGQAIGRLLSVA